MAIGANLRTFLLADSGIAAAVESRVYPIRLPQAPGMPAVTYFKVSGLRHYGTAGPEGLSRPRIQIDCWARTYAAALSVAELVRQRLEGYSGAMGSATIQGVFFENEQEFFEAEPELYRVSRDYMVFFEE